MKRELKFRAWHLEGERMIEWDSLKNLRYAIDNENVHVMQWSGIIDKKEMAVYEGDILKFDVGARSVRKVIFNNGSFGVVGMADDRDKTFTEFVPFSTMSRDLIERNIYQNLKDLIEVIGNIYEQPELLK
jgi:hypothetical protein